MSFDTFTNTLRYKGTATSQVANRTCGIQFLILDKCKVYGVNFYTAISGAHDIKCCLWFYNTLLDSVDVACTGPGEYQGLFSSPVELDSNDVGGQLNVGLDDAFYVSVWEKTGTNYTRATTPSDWQGIASTTHGAVVYNRDRPWLYSAGDARPASHNGERFPVDPIVEPLDETDPEIVNKDPANTETGVAKDKVVTWSINDDVQVDGTTVVIYITRSEGTEEILYSSGTWAEGYLTSTLKGNLDNGYDIEINPELETQWRTCEIVGLRCYAEDTSGNTVDESWSFTAENQADITDHETAALALLPDQFKESDLLRGLLRSFLGDPTC